jgi:hypothetical protein
MLMTTSRFASTHPLLLASAAASLLLAAVPAQACTSVATGAAAQDHLGWAMAAIGDIDGDAYGDLAVGAPQAGNPVTGGGAIGTGYVRLLSGRTGAVLGTVNGTQTGELFGWAIASLVDTDGDGRPDSSGDINGDAVPDFLVSAPWFDGANPRQGQVYVVSGATRAIVGIIPNPNPTTGALFGTGISCVGDIAGNGRPEFVIGAPFWSAAGGGTGGRVYLYGWGAGTTAVQLSVRQGAGSSSGTNLGNRVCGVGDANGDGVRDVLVQEDGTQTVLLISLGAFTGAPIATIAPPATYSGNAFGLALLGLGDLDGNGNEFAIGVPDCVTGTCPGSGFVEIRSANATGSTLRNTVRPTARIGQLNNSISIRFGTALAGVGDLDGDGFGELAIGAPTADPVGTTSLTDDAGEVHVFVGSSLLVSGGARLRVVFDGVSGETMGQSLAGLANTAVNPPQYYLATGAPESGLPAAAAGRAVIVRHLRKSRLYGNGCAPAPLEPPEFHVGVDGGPCAGDTLGLHMTQMPPNSICVLAAGLSSANVPGVLQPQCTLLVQPDVTQVVLPGNVRFASFPFSVPASAVGIPIYWQWWALGSNFPLTVESSPGLVTIP